MNGRIILIRRSLLKLAGVGLVAGCADDAADPKQPGAQAPTWQLSDVQPESEAYGEVYGLDAFRGTPVLVALLAGSCNVCVGIAYSLESFLQDLLAEDLDVRFCAVNEASDGNAHALSDVCSFPVFQDDAATNAFGMHGGGRDDLFVYTSGGLLVQYFQLPVGEPDGNPATEAGRANLRDALLTGL
jgi:hypothetical protein